MLTTMKFFWCTLHHGPGMFKSEGVGWRCDKCNRILATATLRGTDSG